MNALAGLASSLAPQADLSGAEAGGRARAWAELALHQRQHPSNLL